MSSAEGAQPTSSSAQAALTGIGLTVVACALFALLDSGTKFTGQYLPMLMVVWLRFISQALVTTAWVLPRQGIGALRTEHPRFQISRALSGVMTTVFAFYCIQNMPLANFTAVWSAGPLLIVVTSALLFGEKVSSMRWGLLVIGLLAVIAIVRPEQDGMPLGWMALAPVGVLLCGTTYQLLGSRLARLDPPTTTQLYTTWLPVIATAPFIPWIWESVHNWQVWVAVVMMGVCSGIGHLLLLQAYAHATPSVVSPFLYSQIGFAMLMGWLFFEQVPDSISLVGISVIALCGFVNIWISVYQRR
ncbi:DMT family transporter [Comamonas sp. NoAH]|uniref:DMT family transporter n=1 Tax=Comamonas halotolerans TaxID=3041496 RepID=UPI0024E1555D|nr:DMT family transporter [Comamonas sp. NoAH]